MHWQGRVRSQLVLAATLGLAAVGAQAQGAPKPPVNALAAGAANVGLTACKPALDRLSALAVAGARGNDVLLDWDRKRPASSPVFALIGLDFPSGGAAMAISTAPDGLDGCAVNAERISAAPVSCQAVAARELAGQQATRLLSNFTVYTDRNDPTATVSLIDTPPGCLVIRRYTEFNWRPQR